VTHDGHFYENPVQISSQLDENLRISEIWPILIFWLMLTSKIIGDWIEWGYVKILLKSQVNRMKIDNFKNLTYVDLFAYVDLKKIGSCIQWLNVQILFKFQVNWMKIDNFRNPVYVDLLACVDLKNNCWLNSATWYKNAVQISSQSDENWGFHKFGHVDIWPMLTSKVTANSHGHITCGKVSISSAEWFSMYALNKMHTCTTYDIRTYDTRYHSRNPAFRSASTR